MSKLTAAGILAAGALGVSLPANATTNIYDIAGTFGSLEQSCSQIAYLLNADCSFGRNRPHSPPKWIGPQFGGGHYAQGSIGDDVTHIPTFGVFVPAVPATVPVTGTYTPAVDDGKVAAPVTGTFSIDDRGTSDPADDLISANFSIGSMVRNLATGQFARSVQRWTTMAHTMAPTAVNATETVANAAGGVDYVIGSRGFPTPLCNSANSADCFSTANSSPTIDKPSQPRFWADRPAGSVGIEAVGLLGDPAFVLVPTPPTPPTGNVGARSTATFAGYSCSSTGDNPFPADDCSVSQILWGVGEDAGFDNMVMKISTNSLGAITSALIYWTQEYFIGAGGPPPLYDNSWQGGTINFTGQQQSVGPEAKDFAASVLQGSSGNTLDTVTNTVNFTGVVTVTIVTPPTKGTATVNANQTLNYNSTGATGTDTIVYQSTNGFATDTGIITITVAADTQPVAPDGPISISTAGSAPASTPGTVNVASLPGYMPGNTPSTVAITTPPDPAKGMATISGTTITFTPAATFFTGTDTIGYTITDGDSDPDSGVITVTIADVNPVLADNTITTDQDTASSAVSLGINPGNGSVAQHTLVVSTAATHGSCALTGTTIKYTPDAAYFGSDSCVLTITDGDGDTDTATITITVNEVSGALTLPGGGSAIDLWSLTLLGALPLLRRRRKA